MDEKVFICCPSCSSRLEFEVNRKLRYVMYKCPSCGHNVVKFGNKVTEISDSLFKQVMGASSGVANVPLKLSKKRVRPITNSFLEELHELLESKSDVLEILAKI